MSGDRWAVCPRCKVNAEAAQRRAFDRAAEAYGQVSSEEYEKLRRDAQVPVILEDTLREDYEFYFSETGEFSAEFQARCTECEFSFAFKYEEQVKVEP